MSKQAKISKLLVGMLINTGDSLGEVARHLGISVTDDESHAYLSIMETDGLIIENESHSKHTCPELTHKGISEAKILMDSNSF